MKFERGDTLLFVLMFLSISGIFFIGTIVHEIIHVAQSNGESTSICIASNLKIDDEVQKGYILAYTTFNEDFANVESFSSWREEAEKIANILTKMFIIVLTAIVFILIGYYIGLDKNLKITLTKTFKEDKENGL